MENITVNIPDAVLYDTRMTADSAQAFVKRAAALLYYKTKGVSLGYCAQIAEMSKMDLIRFLNENNISVFELTEEELAEDIANA